MILFFLSPQLITSLELVDVDQKPEEDKHTEEPEERSSAKTDHCQDDSKQVEGNKKRISIHNGFANLRHSFQLNPVCVSILHVAKKNLKIKT